MTIDDRGTAGYAVVDVETTGLSPARHDRVVEIAAVLVDLDGRVEGDWSTLVNPRRDLGPQHVHGITAADARRAPTFEQIAGELARVLRGRVLVAHNVAFDAMFIGAEFRRLGADIPDHGHIGLCTMQLAARFLPAGRRLSDCCLAAGVPLENAHCALDDAHAAAGLLAYYLARSGRPEPWAATVAAARVAAWPAPADVAFDPVHRSRPDAPAAHFLSRLVARLPRADDPDADAYLDLLDRALVNRAISATDADALVDHADRLGLGRDEVAGLHRRYLAALTAAALADGPLTGAAREDLLTVATLLGLDRGDLDAAAATPPPAPVGLPRYGRFGLVPGDVVVLTGTFRNSKDALAARVAAAGLTPEATLTKRTKLLVAADVDTMSGKAEKARQYGIPIVGEPALLRLLGDG